MSTFILSIDAAKGMQKKHGHIMRDLDRVASMLSAEERKRWLIPATYTDGRGKTHRAYSLLPEALPLLLAGKETKTALRWIADRIPHLTD